MLSFRAGFFWVAECIHNDVAKLASAFCIGDVYVFVEDVEEVHQVTTRRMISVVEDVDVNKAGRELRVTDPSL